MSSGHVDSRKSIVSLRFRSLIPATHLGLWIVLIPIVPNLTSSIRICVSSIAATLGNVHAPLRSVAPSFFAHGVRFRAHLYRAAIQRDAGQHFCFP